MDLVHTLFRDNLNISMVDGDWSGNNDRYWEKRRGNESESFWTEYLTYSWTFDTFRPLYYGWYDYGFELARLTVVPIFLLVSVLLTMCFMFFFPKPENLLLAAIIYLVGAAYSFISAVINLITRPVITLLLKLYSVVVEPAMGALYSAIIEPIMDGISSKMMELFTSSPVENRTGDMPVNPPDNSTGTTLCVENSTDDMPVNPRHDSTVGTFIR